MTCPAVAVAFAYCWASYHEEDMLRGRRSRYKALRADARDALMRELA